jgi:uncharacterized protein YlxP (DUF503 family)
MHVAVARFTLMVPSSHSLKDKRAVMRRIKDRVQQRFHVTLAEVAAHDTWQRIELAFAVVTAQRDQADDAVGSVLGFVESLGMGELVHSRREINAYGEDWYQAPAADPRRDDDQSWVPAAWLADSDEEGSR